MPQGNTGTEKLNRKERRPAKPEIRNPKCETNPKIQMRKSKNSTREVKGKQKTEAWLARQLRVFGPQSRTMWIGGVSARGYLLEDFVEAFRPFLPASELQAIGGILKAKG